MKGKKTVADLVHQQPGVIFSNCISSQMLQLFEGEFCSSVKFAFLPFGTEDELQPRGSTQWELAWFQLASTAMGEVSARQTTLDCRLLVNKKPSFGDYCYIYTLGTYCTPVWPSCASCLTHSASEVAAEVVTKASNPKITPPLLYKHVSSHNIA